MSKRSVKHISVTRAYGAMRKLPIATLAVAASLAAMVGVAQAAPRPGWEVTSRLEPTHLAPGKEGVVVVEVYNTGAASSTSPVTMTDVLPPGMEATRSGPLTELGEISQEEVEEKERIYYNETEKRQSEGEVTVPLGEPRVWACSGTTVVTCHTAPGYEGVERPIDPGYKGRIGIEVRAVGSEGVADNHVTVSGGGAAGSAEVSDPFTISSTEPGFGLNGEFDGWFSTPEGTTDTQAGSHPFNLTFSFGLNLDRETETSAGGSMRDIKIELPPGIVGDPHATPQCTRQQLLSSAIGGCPPDTNVGWDEASVGPFYTWADWDIGAPIYNMVPPAGVPAEFAFTVFGSVILIDASVRSGSDYGITTISRNIGYKPVFNTITLWGAPNEEVHDPQRCGIGAGGVTSLACGYKASGGKSQRPLLTLPTSCEGPLETTLTIDSWDKGLAPSSESFVSHEPSGVPVGLTGCERLAFPPSLTVAPDTSYADTPAGLTADVKVPQEGLTTSEGIATANIKDTTVTLPEGVAINPGQAAGLTACGPAEDGLTTPAEEAAGGENNGPAHCPSASQVGTDEIETPVLSKALKGNVYVLPSNPPRLKLLVTAQGEGVFLKLIGSVSLDESTGRLTTTFEKTPELPFTDFKLSFSGGAQAALSTPTKCGTYTSTSDFVPWSTPIELDASPSSSFQIASGSDGGACPSSSLPFSPSMIAGSTTDQAGGFTSFSLLLTRPDDQQRVGTLQFKTPEGLLGMISKVPLCPEPQAAQGTCSSASQIGHTVVEAGPGPYPLVVPQPGQAPAPIYLTGGYKGAPYGLSIVVPLHVGPFTLQTQVVRAKIEVNPLTTQLTVTTDPLPQIIDGVPADLRTINAVIDKPGFMFNPTGCEPSSFSGTATGSEGASAPLTSHFQMGSCRSLTFKPNFKVSTAGKTSRAEGASLDAKILYPTGELGDNQASSQSNVKSVKVDLPKQLPSRLTTLQKACTAATFEANPANCPADSRVGSAMAVTPVLPVTLTGPAYFVSYGGAKFPELVVVLQGYGVTVDLHGETFISKAGITSSTFRQVPDVPITSFELKLPEGPFSALAANGNLCTTKLAMPTAFTGQNGAVLKQSTPISVTGCAKHTLKGAGKVTKKKSKKSGKANGHNHGKKK